MKIFFKNFKKKWKYFLGIPSLGLIPIDPLIISQLDINQGSSSEPLNLKLNFKDLYIHNIGSIKLTSMKWVITS